MSDKFYRVDQPTISQMTEKAVPNDDDVFIMEDSAASWASKKIKASALSGVFGNEFDHEEDNGQSSTSASAWQVKLTLTTPSGLPSGTYIIFWYCELSVDDKRALVAGACHKDDSDYLGAIDWSPSTDESDEECPFSGFAVRGMVGQHTIQIKWAVSNGIGNAYIRKAHLAMFRVA
jgi:hypothetical protein